MWYFAWILGLPLAVTFAVLNAMWFEILEDGRETLDEAGHQR
ncbi:cytochrome bd-I oxidase subunit CydX [Haematobacter missouriensis]|uniref:Cytochrome bd-I oxidase subunit CydX n=1 Tax=Haematobacter missouriensis TaxID=366616 RepID=A0A212ANC8_9RHOB|nr:cytochrome bd-I oxidase subunit CydX [Haematobacter missouriensis]OWJ71104.1 cytochrome bd-I oxidase subunit CydX [Haematobacter missouriensis]OWJ82806.1 cytochrome bd-I oxidase subunit CydX [Haematobacter missouriensis]